MPLHLWCVAFSFETLSQTLSTCGFYLPLSSEGWKPQVPSNWTRVVSLISGRATLAPWGPALLATVSPLVTVPLTPSGSAGQCWSCPCPPRSLPGLAPSPDVSSGTDERSCQALPASLHVGTTLKSLARPTSSPCDSKLMISPRRASQLFIGRREARSQGTPALSSRTLSSVVVT